MFAAASALWYDVLGWFSYRAGREKLAYDRLFLYIVRSVVVKISEVLWL